MKPLILEETRTKTDNHEMCIKGIDELPIFSWNTKTKEFYVLGHKFNGINSVEDFINYIHNLDKENKSLQSQLKAKEEENKQLKEKLDCDLQWAFKYEKQVDNWNKLEEYLKSSIQNIEPTHRQYECDRGIYNACRMSLKKMQEIRGDK